MRRPSQTVFRGCLAVGGRIPEDSTEESGLSIPIQSAIENAWSFYVFETWKGTVKGIILCFGGVL